MSRRDREFGELFEALHEGVSPKTVEAAKAARGKAEAVCRIASISYTTIRGDVRAVWRHPFDVLPILLESDKAGHDKHPRCRSDLAVVGWIIELTGESGRRILMPGYAACSDDKGRLRLASLWGGRYSLACDDDAIRVTRDGIIG